jgi:methylated-DNA-[protein]-cysteine S-methyltransferase
MYARTIVNSPVGPLYLEASSRGLRKLAFETTEKFGHALAAQDEDSAAQPEAEAVLARAIQQLEEYFDGARHDVDLPLDLEGSPFRKAMWQAIGSIPYADTISYAELAARGGAPGAYRAAGAACGANPVAIVIPCHRVLGSDRSLHGFGGGLPVKRWLLDHEAANSVAIRSRQPLLV